MYSKQRERIPDLLESPNSRRDLRNLRISNDHFRRYDAVMNKYERLSPHPRRRLTSNIRLEQQYHNFHGYSSSDECLLRNKSKSTSSIDTQSVNNILDEFEDLNYRKSSDLSDLDVDSVEVTNFEQMMDYQKRQVTEKQNSRFSKSHSQVTTKNQHQTSSPTKISRQTQVQQRSRDRQRDNEKKLLSPSNERKHSAPTFQSQQEVRASIRSAKTPPEVLLRKGEVQKRVDEWLSQTRNQNCAGFKESKGLTRSNSSAEQKTHRRLRQQELRARRSQLNGSSSYDDLSHEGLKIDRNKASDSNKVSVGVNTSRGTYKQYLALKNKARLQKQQERQENSNQEHGKPNVALRSREASPATGKHYHSRNDAMNLSFRNSQIKRQDYGDIDQPPQQPQQQYTWSGEPVPPVNIKSKSARARHQMENRIFNIIKARHDLANSPEVSAATTPATAGIGRRSSFKRESTRSISKSANASPSKEAEESIVAVKASQEQTISVTTPTKSSEQDKAIESNLLTESSSDMSQEIYGSVSARVRAFQGRSEHRMPKSRSLQGSNILIDTRNKSPLSPTKNDGLHYTETEHKQQSTFKPNFSQQNEQSVTKRDREIDSTTRYVEKIYETTLQPEVIHADNLESIFKPGRTNFVYGDTTSKDMTSSAPIFKKEDESTKRKTINYKETETKESESPLNHCLKLLQKSPSFRIKKSHAVQKEKESFTKLSVSEQAVVANDQPKQTNFFETFQTTNSSTGTSQINATENQVETSKNEQSVMHEKLDPNSYEARSTLKLNSQKTLNDQIENEKNKQKDSSLKENPSKLCQGIIDQSKNDSTSSTSNTMESTYNSLREKSEDGAVISEVLVKNLQFKQDLPTNTPPAPPPRTCLEPVRKQESALIVELTPLRNKPLNYNSVLSDDYANLHARNYQQQQQQQENGKIYVTKEEMERRKLMFLLKKENTSL